MTSGGGQISGAYYGDIKISASGRYVIFAGHTTGLISDTLDKSGNVFVHDRDTGQTILVSTGPDGRGGDDVSWAPHIAENGDFVVFQSHATNLIPGDTNSTYQLYVAGIRYPAGAGRVAQARVVGRAVALTGRSMNR